MAGADIHGDIDLWMDLGRGQSDYSESPFEAGLPLTAIPLASQTYYQSAGRILQRCHWQVVHIYAACYIASSDEWMVSLS